VIVKAVKKPYDEKTHRVLLDKLNTFVGIDHLIDRINRNEIELYEVYADDSFLGMFLSRIEKLLDGERELVILHASAIERPKVALTSVLDYMFDKVARDHGLKSLRVHSDKKGLDRIMEAHKYKFQEAVYRKAL